MGNKLSKTEISGFYTFHCVGCGYDHHVNTNPDFAGGKVWDFNQNFESPTVRPSLLVNANIGKRCHLFITDGKIQYLNDCDHDLRGQTVDMLDEE